MLNTDMCWTYNSKLVLSFKKLHQVSNLTGKIGITYYLKGLLLI